MTNVSPLTAFLRYVRYFDFTSFFLTLALTTIGLAFVFSATYQPECPYSTHFKKQLFGMGCGYLLYFFFCFVDYRPLQRWGFFLYFAVLGLLIFTTIKGTIGLGARRWINLGFFKFQPSELTKLFFPPFFTYYLYTDSDNNTFTLSYFLPTLVVTGISALLIIKQPDLGTGILILSSAFTLLWVAGMHKKYFYYGLAIFLITLPITYHMLHPYQKKRIAVFLGEGNNKKERYQIEQSKIAIGSGGLIGKGFLQGTQNLLLFLPESQTDCIFSVICEEVGFLGALGIMALYVALMLRSLFIIYFVKLSFARLLAVGLLMPFIFSTFINIGMVTGLLPIVGIPLPLITYGITHTWITLASLGWIQGIAIRQYYLGD